MKKNNLKKLKKGLAMCLASAMITSFALPAQTEAATWKKNNTGWWWQEDNGSYPVNKWVGVKGRWYHFDGTGYMNYGWYWDGSSWYYLGGKEDGSMKTGWQFINGKWYYMNGDGAMLSNQWVGNYWVDGSGAWTKTMEAPRWVKSGSRWWYRHGDGGYQTNGWGFINGKWYYFDNAGWMVTGWKQVNGSWYYMDASGAMLANQWVGNYYVGADGAWVRDKQPEHAHKWVAQTSSINHPEESHQELVKEAWSEEVHHDAEYKKVVDKEAWTETIDHPEESHQELVKEAWTETIDHPEESHQELVKEAWTETIDHPEEGHYEVEEDGYWTLKVSASEDGKEYSCERVFVEFDTKICDENGMDVEVPVFEQKYRNICNGCGADITGNEYDHNDNHMLNGEKSGWHSEYRTYQTGTKTEHYDAYWVVDKEAWTETVNHDAEYKTVVDKKAWTETINHDAEYKKVVDKEAWTETIDHPEESHQELVREAWTETVNHPAEYKKVVDKEAWTEKVTTYKCSCGATK